MPRRYTSDADRRARDREIQRLAANRRVGHDHAYLILFGPAMARGVGLLLLAAFAVWLWFEVDHKVIAFAAAAMGVALLVLYAASTIASTGNNARMMARATGRSPRPFWWHGVGLAGVVLLALAYVVLPL
jgi:hypothetical protein